MLGASWAVSIFPAPVAKADSSLQNPTWLNQSTITGTVNGTPVTFFDGDVEGQIAKGQGTKGAFLPGADLFTAILTYQVNSDYACPDSKLSIQYTGDNPIGHNGLGQAKAYFAAPPTGNGACQYPSTDPSKQPTVDLTSAESFFIIYAISSDGNTIGRVDGNSTWVFTKSTDPADGPNLYRNGTSQCSSVIITDPANNTYVMYELYYPGAGKNPAKSADTPAPPETNSNGCYEVDPQNAQSGVATGLTGSHAFTTGAPTSQTPSGVVVQRGTNNTTTPGITCSGGGALGWFVCPLVKLFSNLADQLNTAVIGQLNVDVNNYLPDIGPNSQVKQIWAAIRDISLGLLVIVALFMVISQAIGVGPFDAYTVRKILPRILMAVILITLSWPLGRFFVQLSNDVGGQVQSLIDSIAQVQPISISASAGYVTTLLAAGGIVALTIGGVLSLAVSAVLALFIGLVVLILRRLIILACVIAAPLAIIDHILPGPDRIWKIWKDSFIGALAAFPIITGAIGLGAVLAQIQSKVSSSSPVNDLIVFILYFGPYLLLPAILRAASGAVSTLAGVMNDRSRGAFDRLKKGRQNMTAKSLHDMKTGERFNNRALNALTSRATTQNFGFGRRGQAAYNQKQDLASAEFAKSSAGIAMQHNDPGNRALTYGSGIEARANMARDFDMYKDAAGNATGNISMATRDSINEADLTVQKGIAAAQASGGWGRNRQIWAAQQLSNTATGYGNLEQVAQTMARVSHGNEAQIDSLAGNINSGAKAVGRPELAPGFSDLSGLAKAEAGGRSNLLMYETARMKATGAIDGISVMRGKPDTAVKTIASNLSVAVRNNPSDEVSARKLHEMINGMSYGSSPAQEHLIEAVGKTQSVELQDHLKRALDTIRQGRSTDPAAFNINTTGDPGGAPPPPPSGP